jgi:hypothetical protein
MMVDLEDLAGAEELFKKSLDIRKRVFGEEHLDTVNCEDWLDSIADMKEEFEAAGKLPVKPEYPPEAAEADHGPRDSYDARFEAMALEEGTKAAEEAEEEAAAASAAAAEVVEEAPPQSSQPPRDSLEARLLEEERGAASTSAAASLGKPPRSPSPSIGHGGLSPSHSAGGGSPNVEVESAAAARTAPPPLRAPTAAAAAAVPEEPMSQRQEEFLAAKSPTSPNMRVTVGYGRGPANADPDPPPRRLPRHSVAPALSSQAPNTHAAARTAVAAAVPAVVPMQQPPSPSPSPPPVESAMVMSEDLRSSGDAVEAASASIDAMLRQYNPEAVQEEPSPPPAAAPSSPQQQQQQQQWQPQAGVTQPAARMSVPAHLHNQQQQQHGARASVVGVQRPSYVAAPQKAAAAAAPAYQSPPQQSVPVWESTPETESAPGLAEAALDAFLSAHVEYLGNRQYRCVLDGKILSKFSIMRVHVAKKFGGLVHQWAVEQRVIDRRSPAPAAAAPATIQEHGGAVQVEFSLPIA